MDALNSWGNSILAWASNNGFTGSNIIGGFLSAAVAFSFCSLDLYQTISQSEFQSKNLFKSPAIVLFIALNASISLVTFVLTCAYPGEWIAKVIGQEIGNPLFRGAVVGAMVTAIVRSQLVNLDNTKGLGVDAGYSLLRTLALRRLNLMTTVEVNELSREYQDRVRHCPAHDPNRFVAHIMGLADDLLRSLYSHDIARRDRIIERFEKATAGLSTFQPISDLGAEGLAIKLAMNYCGIKLIKNDLDNWLVRHQQAAAGSISL